MGNRHSVIPQEHWTLMGKPVELLDADLTELENASPAAGPAVIPGANAWVRPNLQGGWDRLTRVPGVSYWWQRPITSTTNAPVPQYADGYEDGDLVSPLLGGEVLPYRGIVLSETGAATDAATVTGRATNNYAGGNDAYLWGGVKAIPTGEGRARFVPGNYLELYDGGYATITSPALPISTAFRCSWDVNLPASNWGGGLVIAGTTPTERNVLVWASGGSAAGTVAWSVRSMFPDAWAGASVTLGTATAAVWERATVTVTGDQVQVQHGGSTFTYNLPPEAAAAPRQFGFGSAGWTQLSARNIVLEAL